MKFRQLACYHLCIFSGLLIQPESPKCPDDGQSTYDRVIAGLALAALVVGGYFS